MKKLTFIDLFAGAGGMSEGFVRAGFTPIAHVEMNPNACKTLLTRTAYHYLKDEHKLNIYTSYLKKKVTYEDLIKTLPSNLKNSVHNYEISDETTTEIFELIDQNMGNQTETDLIIGGPPCQAYSLLGRHRVDVINDPRNMLYKQYGKFLERYKPNAFVFENVLGLLTANKGKYFNDIKEYFSNIGYTVDYRILDASDYGVLQKRKRVIIVGWKKGMNKTYPVPFANKSSYSISELFKDLPKLYPGETIDIVETNESKKILQDLSIKSAIGFTTQHNCRPHNNRDLAIYKLAIEEWTTSRKRLKYTDLPENLRTHKNISSFLDRFKVVDGKGFSHTLVAHIAKDGHYFIHPDMAQCRSISVREAARIQSFPDDYFFEGARGSAFTQIGNAVPPILAYAIAKKLKEKLNSENE